MNDKELIRYWASLINESEESVEKEYEDAEKAAQEEWDSLSDEEQEKLGRSERMWETESEGKGTKFLHNDLESLRAELKGEED